MPDFTEILDAASLPGRPAHLRPIPEPKPLYPKSGIADAATSMLDEWVAKNSTGPITASPYSVKSGNPAVGPSPEDKAADYAAASKTFGAKAVDFTKAVKAGVRTGDAASVWKGFTENRPELKVDPNFDLMKRLPEMADKYFEHLDTLRSARSDAELDEMAKRFDAERKDNEDLGSSFFGSLVGGIIGNPIQMAVGVGEVRLASTLWRAAKLTKPAGLAVSATIAGASGAVQEAARQKLQYGAVDDARAVGVMAIMNAGIQTAAIAHATPRGAALKAQIEKPVVPQDTGPIASAEPALVEQSRRGQITEAAASMQPAVTAADYAESRLVQSQLHFSADAEEVAQRAANAGPIKMPNNQGPRWPDGLAGHRAGATLAPPAEEVPTYIKAGAAERAIIDFSENIAGKMTALKDKMGPWQKAVDWMGEHSTWFDSFGKSMKSESSVVRAFMLQTGEDSTGILRELGTDTAAQKARTKKVFDSKLLPITDEHNAWRNRKDYSLLDRMSGKADRDFNAALRTELEIRNNTKHLSKADQAAKDAERAAYTDPEITRSADAWEDAHKYAAETWGEHDEVMRGSFGDSSRGYVTRYLDGEMLSHLAFNEKDKYKALMDLHARRTFEHINEGIEARNARGETRTVYRKQPTPEGVVNKVPEQVPYEPISMAEARGMSEAMFENAIARSNGEAGSMIGLLPHDGRDEMRRLMESKGFSEADTDRLFAIIDASVGDAGRSARGKGRMNIDIISPDDKTGMNLLDIYDNNMPRVARKYGDEFSGRAALAAVGMKSNSEIEMWIKAAHAQHASDEDRALMRSTVDQLLGRGEPRNKAIQALDGWMRAAMLGQASFAQAAESATVAANVGIWATIKTLPELSNMMHTLSGGVKQDHPLLVSLEPYLGKIGSDHKLLKSTRQMDNAHFNDGATALAYDLALKYNKNVNDVVSMFSQVHDYQMKLSVIGMSRKIVEMIRSGDIHPRLTDAGVHGEWTERIKAQLEKHSEYNERGIADFKFDQWDDQHAANQMQNSMHRVANQLVQGHLVGETSAFMNTDLGKMIVGFRTFPFVALRKQLIRNLYYADSTTFMTYALGMAFSYAIVAAKANLQTVGMSDSQAKKYLKTRLDDKNLFMAAGQYAGAMGPVFDLIGAADSFANGHRKYDIGDSVPILGFTERAVNTGAGAFHAATGLGRRDDTLLKDGVRLTNGTLPAVWLGNALSK